MKSVLGPVIAIILCLSMSGCFQNGGDGSLPPPAASEDADATSTSSPDAPAEETQADLYEDILLTFGAQKTTDERGEPRLRISGVSFYYMPDTENLAERPPNAYFSWYLSMSHKEKLTDEERAAKYKSPFGEDSGWFFPQDDYEALIQQYFGVSAAYLRSGSAYQAEHNGYWLDGHAGLGISTYIILYKAEQEGDGLRLYHTHVSGDYDLAYAPPEYKILSVRLREDGSYQYLSYITDANPSSEQIEAAKRDNTAFSTGIDVLYSNKDLGFAVRFPDNWKDNYTVQTGELYFSAVESEDVVGVVMDFLYKDQGHAVLGRVDAVPVEVWDTVRGSSTSFDVVLGQNSRYIFTCDMRQRDPFAPGADHDLFQELLFAAQDLSGMVTITEPNET